MSLAFTRRVISCSAPAQACEVGQLASPLRLMGVAWCKIQMHGRSLHGSLACQLGSGQTARCPAKQLQRTGSSTVGEAHGWLPVQQPCSWPGVASLRRAPATCTLHCKRGSGYNWAPKGGWCMSCNPCSAPILDQHNRLVHRAQFKQPCKGRGRQAHKCSTSCDRSLSTEQPLCSVQQARTSLHADNPRAHLDQHRCEAFGAKLLVHAQEVYLHHGHRVLPGTDCGWNSSDESDQLPVAGHAHAQVPFRLEPWRLQRPLQEGVGVLEPAPGRA